MYLQTVRITKDFKDLDNICQLAKTAFPPEEYLSPDVMIRMQEEGNFDFFALYDEGTFIGYISMKLYKLFTYLFFFAIKEEYRDQGYGSEALRFLKENYKDSQIIVDLEMLDDQAENHEQRKKRRNFYLRNGFLPTHHFVNYFGVDYEILCMDDHFDFETFREMMDPISIEGFHPRYFEK